MIKRVEAPEELKGIALEAIERGFEKNMNNIVFKFEYEERHQDSDDLIEYHDELQKQMTDTKIRCMLNIGVSEDGSLMNIPINEGMLKKWNVTKEDVFDVCMKNVDNEIFHLRPMGEVISEICGDGVSEILPGELPSNAMYVLSNQSNVNGARMILSDHVKWFLKKQLGKYYIIPSSIHELLIIPEGTNSQEALEEMVKDVNNTVLSENELLSYHVAFVA